VNRVLQIFSKRPVLITIVVCMLMYVVTGLTSDTSFFNIQTFVNLFQKNAPLGIVAVGMTFVILTGGIDLSVGSIIGWTALLAAFLISAPEEGQKSFFHNWNPYLAMATVVVIATIGGTIIGYMVHHLEIPPFLITLAFLFLYRGWALVVSTGDVIIEDPRVSSLNDLIVIHGLSKDPATGKEIPLFLYPQTLLILFIVGLGAWVGRYTRFGRSLYAIGGSESSAMLMGLPVARSKIIVYALCGFCASLGGLAYLTKDMHGTALSSRGMELDAIAVTVIGGTLLTGGVGGIWATLIGLATYGTISAAMSQHTFGTGVDRMVIGGLLLAFILLQKLLQLRKPTTVA